MSAHAHSRAPFVRSRLRHQDAFSQALTSVRVRPTRSLLSALGIAVGIGAMTAIIGISASNQAQLLARLDAGGANVITVSRANGSTDSAGAQTVLPRTAPAMISRIPGVTSVAVLTSVPDGIHAYKNNVVPSGQSNSLSVAAAGPDYLPGVGATLKRGRWFDQASRALPETVLGSESARLLAVDRIGDRVWIGDQWYLVTGILAPRPLIADLDSTVFVGDIWSESRLWPGVTDLAKGPGHIESITVRADAKELERVRRLVAATTDPARPGDVSVSGSTALDTSRALVDDSLSSLVIVLAGVALLVGAIGIANTMVVAVLERRGEIGLRRALGARPSHIARQFLLECAMISGFGGLAGWCAGAVCVFALAAVGGQVAVVPFYTLPAFPALAVFVGALAGLQPAAKAARVSPTVSLQAG